LILQFFATFCVAFADVRCGEGRILRCEKRLGKACAVIKANYRPGLGLTARSICLVISAMPAAALLLHALPATAATCTSLTSITLPDTEITLAQEVPAGSFTAPTGQVIPNLPAFCRVVGVSTPTSDSNINFEVWLPTSTWNGRYRQVGSSGFGGAIGFTGRAALSLSGSIRSGYAAASTDDGHVDPTFRDASWALGHPQKIIDFGYRALKETTDAAKAVIEAYYGRAADFSYFTGCSEGGREALTEAQRFPDDFDGILVGDPASDLTGNAVAIAWDEQALTRNPAAFLPPSKLPALTKAGLKQCAAREGLGTDPFINDPRDCHFDPAAIRCNGADSDSCLTTAQVEAVRKIYSGPIDRRRGEPLFPGFEPGAEDTDASDGTGGWANWLNTPPGGGLYPLSYGVWAYMVANDPNFDIFTVQVPEDFTVADNAPVGDRTLAAVINSTNPDLRLFKRHGGKIIQYHGWADPVYPPRSSINYYESVIADQRDEARENHGSRSLEEIREFYRLFMAPGMVHCNGGPGPSTFGGAAIPAPPVEDVENDATLALVQWVEQGIAPDKIIATHYLNHDPTQGVDMQRPLCPYPELARYMGTGDTTNAANFVCVRDERDQQHPDHHRD
jgi:Tannase and feruloyl esterase